LTILQRQKYLCFFYTVVLPAADPKARHGVIAANIPSYKKYRFDGIVGAFGCGSAPKLIINA